MYLLTLQWNSSRRLCSSIIDYEIDLNYLLLDAQLLNQQLIILKL